jgi:hypothetical protein
LTRAVLGLVESISRILIHKSHARTVKVVALPPDGPLTAEKGTDDMSKFNQGSIHKQGTGPFQAEQYPTGKTHEGGTGYQRDAKSELFLRATSNFAGEDSFYEQAVVRDEKLRTLVRELAITDSGWEWVQDFLPWLRASASIRSAAIMLAAEAVKARLDKGLAGEGNRQLINAVIQRADEPGEMVAYWLSNHRRAIPKPIKRGIADAVARLYTERSFLRYDKQDSPIRFGDVLEIVHASPKQEGNQGALFAWAITARHGRDAEPPRSLAAVCARRELSKLSPEARHEFARKVKEGDKAAGEKFRMALAGQWEWARSWLGEKDVPSDKG